MDVIRGKVKGGRIDVTVPPDWPEGTSVEVYQSELGNTKVGIDESEWRDDPEAVERFAAWVRSLEPPELTPDEIRENEAFAKRMREFNIEAVRKQMGLGSDS